MQLDLASTVTGSYKNLNRKVNENIFLNTLKIIVKSVLMVQISNSSYSGDKSRRFQEGSS